MDFFDPTSDITDQLLLNNDLLLRYNTHVPSGGFFHCHIFLIKFND